MELSNLDYVDLNIEDYKRISNEKNFLIELVKLSQLGLRKENNEDFHNKVTRLLEYVIMREDSELALLLTATLIEIQNHLKTSANDNYWNTQLSDLFLIQFNKHKTSIYYNALLLLTCHNGSESIRNIEAVLKPKLYDLEGNIYECFDLTLSLALLHSFFLINNEQAAHSLFKDILTDWNEFKGEIKEKDLEKLLWYSFVFGEEQFLVGQVTGFETFIKESNRWGIKFYRFIKKNLSKETAINIEKVNQAIDRFNERKSYSNYEKKLIQQKIQSQLKYKIMRADQTSEQKQVVEKKVKIEPARKTVESVTRLSPYNLPENIKLSDINQKEEIDLVVFGSESRNNVIKKIKVEAIRAPHSNEFYITKPTLKMIREKVQPGYLHVINARKRKKESLKEKETSELFKWPSTDVTGTGYDTDHNGLSEKSELRKLGYQITDSTRSSRWIVLQKAVPAIGLKKVAYTIAGNIKLRKGQKNGKNKFSYAISEWEHDLRQLKANYYKNQFKWPST